MEVVDCTNNFLFAYAKSDRLIAEQVIADFKRRLNIDYELKDYDDILTSDYVLYFENRLDTVQFVVMIVSNNASDDELLQTVYKMSCDRNTVIVPIAFGNSIMLKFSNKYMFRSDLLYYKDEKDRIKLFEQIHSMLGLRVIGNVYGSHFTIDLDAPAKYNVYIDEKLALSDVHRDVDCQFVLAAGTHVLKFESLDQAGTWGIYSFVVETNDGVIEEQLSLMSDYQLSMGQMTSQMRTAIQENRCTVDVNYLAQTFGYVDSKQIRMIDSSRKQQKVSYLKQIFKETYLQEIKGEPYWNHLRWKFLPAWLLFLFIPFLYYYYRSWLSVFSCMIALFILFYMVKFFCQFCVSFVDRVIQKRKIKKVKRNNVYYYQLLYTRLKNVLSLLNYEVSLKEFEPASARALTNSQNTFEDHQYFYDVYLD